MIKKIISLFLLIILSAITFVGCTGTPLIVMHEVLPWSIASASTTEEATYRITKYLGNADDVDQLEDNVADKPQPITHPNSNVIYSLFEGYGIKEENGSLVPYKSDQTKGLTLLRMSLSVWYLDEDYVPSKYSSATIDGMPEIIRSFTVFDRYSLAAKFTYREANVIQLPGEKLNHRMWVDYSGDVLGEKIAKIQYAPYNNNSQITKSSIQNKDHIDNEYLYYYMRALKATDGGQDASVGIGFSLPYENLLNQKKVKPRSLLVTTSKDYVALSPNTLSEQEFNTVYNYFNLDSMTQEEKDDDDQKYKISSYSIIKLDESKSGPIIKAYYSRYPIKENREESLQPLSKVLMQIKTYTYGGNRTTDQGAVYYDPQKLESSIVYQLLNYSQRVTEPLPFI